MERNQPQVEWTEAPLTDAELVRLGQLLFGSPRVLAVAA